MLLLLLVLLAAAAGLAWRALGGASLPGPFGNGVSPDQVAVPGPADSSKPIAGAAPGDGQEPGTQVVVTVTNEELFLPCVQSPVTVQRLTGAELPSRLLAGVGAQLADVPNSRGMALVSIDVGGDLQLVRRVMVDPAAPQAHLVGPAARVAGKVEDASGRAIAGATVWLGELRAGHELQLLTTDAEGLFEGLVASGIGVPFVVRAPGHTATGQFVEVTARGISQDVVLTAAATVTLQLVGVGDVVSGAQVFVVPLDVVSSELSSYPFFMQSLGGRAADAQGRVQLDDLPTQGEVGVVVAHALTKMAAPRPLRLRDGPQTLTVPLQLSPAVVARIVAADGSPVVGARVLAGVDFDRLPTAPMRRLLPAHLALPAAMVAFTDGDGAFRIGTSTGNWRIDAPEHAGRIVAPGELLVLPRWVGPPLELVLQLPPALAGAHTHWLAEINLGGGVRARLPIAEPWRVSLPQAGRFTFEVQTLQAGQEIARERHEHVDATGPIVLTAPAAK